jgi:hypothetical protein
MLPKYTRLSFLSILLAMLYMVLVYSPMWKNPIGHGKFTWDAYGYYAYLPATFIYKDLKQHKYKNYIQVKYGISPMSGAEVNNNYVLQYTCGMAILEAPWFGIGHLIAKTGGYDTDGFSMPYQLSVEYGMMLWCLLGVYLLARFLLRYFSDMVVAITLFGIVLCSNYFVYSTASNTYTHAPLFTVYVLLLWGTVGFYKKPSYIGASGIGLLVGLATLVRPTESIALIIPLLWGVHDRNSLMERIALIKTALPKLGLAIIITMVVGSAQFFYWKHTTGHFFFNSYGDQSFSFLQPHLYKCFLSSRKGWIIYSPIILLALIGFYSFWHKTTHFQDNTLKNHRFVLSLVAFLSIWITFSWDNWWYGGGVGQRGMIQYLPIFAFPFASFVSYLLSRRFAKWGLLLFTTVCLYHNIWVTHGAMYGGYIHTENTNDAYFFATLWRWSKPDADTERLQDNPENKLELKNPKVIYQNDFEQDTTKNSKNTEVINGAKSIQISPQLVYSALYGVNYTANDTKKVAATITVLSHGIDYDAGAYSKAIISFRYKGAEIKQNAISIHRQLQANLLTTIRWTAKMPKMPIDNISILFWNSYSGTTTVIDNVKIEIGE